MNQKVERYFNRLEEEISAGISYDEYENYRNIISVLEEIGVLSKEGQKEWEQELYNHLDEKVEKLNLSVRAYNSLVRAGIQTKNQLRNRILNGRLLDIRNIGVGTAREIILKSVKDGIIRIDELSKVGMSVRWKRATENLQADLKC